MKKGKMVFLPLLAAVAVFFMLPSAARAATVDVANAADLNSALIAAASGDEIRLTANIDSANNISIDGKSVTINVGAHTLNVQSDSGNAVEVKGGGALLLAKTTGALNVITSDTGGTGLKVAGEGSSATVTSVTTNGASSTGIFATGGTATVTGNITANGASSIGVKAWGGTAAVGGDIAMVDRCKGIDANGGAVTVAGGIDVSGLEYTVGVWMQDGSAAVSGAISVSGTSATGILISGGAVQAGAVSATGDYGTGMIVSGGTVHAGTVTVDGGETVKGVDISGGTATAAGVTVDGKGAEAYGVNSGGMSGGDCTISGGISMTGTGVKYGVYQYAAGQVDVSGDISISGGSDSTGVYAGDGTVTVNGGVSVAGERCKGVEVANAGTQVHVGGDVSATGTSSIGAHIRQQAEVSADGTVSAAGDSAVGVFVLDTGTKITAGAAAADGTGAKAVYAYRGEAEITGAVTAGGAGCCGIYTVSQGSVTAAGVSVTGVNSGSDIGSTGVQVNNTGDSVIVGTADAPGSVTVTGNKSCGLGADYGTIAVHGGVYAGNEPGTDEYCVAIQNTNGGASADSAQAYGSNSRGVINRGSGISAVSGSVTVSGADTRGLWVSGGSAQAGSVYAQGSNGFGVVADEGAAVVTGAVTAKGAGITGAMLQGGNFSAQSVSVTEGGSYGIVIYSGHAAVSGSVSVTGDNKTGVHCAKPEEGQATAEVGSIFATGTNSRGASVVNGGQVTAQSINASWFVGIQNVTKGPDDYTEPTTKTNYRTYTDGTSTVWVRIFNTVTFMDGVNPYATRQAAAGTALGADWPADPAKPGYAFYGWFTGADGTGNSYTAGMTITAETVLHAYWRQECTLTFMSGGAQYAAVNFLSGGSVGSENWPADPANPPKTFYGWYTGENGSGTAVDSATQLVSDTTVYAWWRQEYSVSVSANNTELGSVTGGGKYPENTGVQLRAIPKAGCRFVRWWENDSQLSTDAIYDFTITSDRTILAVFAAIGKPEVTASPLGYKGVQLGWTTVTGAVHYEVWRSTTTAAGTYTKAGETTGSTYEDTNLAPGKTCYYRVRAVCKKATATTYGPFSDFDAATPVPAAPASVSAQPAGYNSARVEWSAVDGAAGYDVYRSKTKDSGYISGGRSPQLFCLCSGLDTGSLYYFKVRPYWASGTSKVYGDYSEPAGATPALSPVSSAWAMSTGPTKVKVSWSAVPGASKYEIWRADLPAPIAVTSSVSYENSGLVPGTTYSYTIIAYRLVGAAKVYAANASPEASATPQVGKIYGLAAKAASPVSIKLTWSAAAGQSGYEVWRRSAEVPGFDKSFDVPNGKTTSYTDSTLSVNHTYVYKVRAYVTTEGGKVYGEFSDEARASVAFGDAGGVAAAMTGVNVNKITWKAVPGANGYSVAYAAEEGGPYSEEGLTAAKTVSGTSIIHTHPGGGQTYWYRVRACVNSGNGPQYSEWSAPVRADNKVMGAAAAAASPSSVKISWKPVPGRTGYEVERCTTGLNGDFVKVFPTGAVPYTATTWTDPNRVPGQTYYYRVRAYARINAAIPYNVYCGYSDIVSAAPALGNVTGVTADMSGVNANIVKWKAVPGASGYKVEWSTAEGGPYSEEGLTAGKTYTGLSIAHSNLQAGGQTYWYRVRAYVNITPGGPQHSSWSAPIPAYNKIGGAAASAVSPASVKISWKTVPGASKYEIWRSVSAPGDLSFWKETTGVTITDTGLTPAQTYYYAVRAYKLLGSTKIYTGFSETVQAEPALADVANVIAAMYSVTSNKITWSAVPGASGYVVQWAESETGPYQNLTPAADYKSTSILHKNLAGDGKTYWYRVQAYVTVGGTRYYSTESVLAAYNKITGAKGSMFAIGANQITWPAVAERKGYEVWRSTDPDTGFVQVAPATSVPWTATAFMDTNVTAGQAYYYKVRAYMAVGGTNRYCAYSDTVKVEYKVSGVTAAAVSPTGLKVSWQAVSGADGYEVWRSSTGLDDYVKIVPSGSLPFRNASYTDTNLATDQKYYYKICAYDTIGGVRTDSGFSDAVSATPALAGVKSPKAARVSATSVKISWSAVAGAAGYEVRRCTTGLEEDYMTVAYTNAVTSWTDTGLETGTKYYYSIRARLETGGSTHTGEWSAQVSATP